MESATDLSMLFGVAVVWRFDGWMGRRSEGERENEGKKAKEKGKKKRKKGKNETTKRKK